MSWRIFWEGIRRVWWMRRGDRLRGRVELFDRRVRLGAKGALSTLWAFVYRPPYRPRGEIRRILIIVYPPGLGDYVVVTSFLTAVGAAFDGASLEVLAGGPHAEVLGSHPSISDAILYEDSWISKDEQGSFASSLAGAKNLLGSPEGEGGTISSLTSLETLPLRN